MSLELRAVTVEKWVPGTRTWIKNVDNYTVVMVLVVVLVAL